MQSVQQSTAVATADDTTAAQIAQNGPLMQLLHKITATSSPQPLHEKQLLASAADAEGSSSPQSGVQIAADASVAAATAADDSDRSQAMSIDTSEVPAADVAESPLNIDEAPAGLAAAESEVANRGSYTAVGAQQAAVADQHAGDVDNSVGSLYGNDGANDGGRSIVSVTDHNSASLADEAVHGSSDLGGTDRRSGVAGMHVGSNDLAATDAVLVDNELADASTDTLVTSTAQPAVV